MIQLGTDAETVIRIVELHPRDGWVFLEAAAALVGVQGDRGRLDAEGRGVAEQTGPVRFLAIQLGTDAEAVIRWLVALLVMLIDPSAVVLTIAAARRRPGLRCGTDALFRVQCQRRGVSSPNEKP